MEGEVRKQPRLGFLASLATGISGFFVLISGHTIHSFINTTEVD
jgi:hypothetical protein